MPAPALFDVGPHAPCPVPFNIAAYVTAQAAHLPDKPALLVLGAPGEVLQHLTHSEIRAAILRTAGGLKAAGIQKRDRVLLRLPSSSEFPILFYALTALGALPVPVSAQLTPTEVADVVADLAPALICLGSGLDLPATKGVKVLGPDALTALRGAEPAEPVATMPDDPAFMVYTSGTGGRPKGVLHAHRTAWARRMMWQGWYGLGPEDRVLHAGAFNWTYTLGAGLTDPWAAGATALIHAGAAHRGIWADLAAAHGATIFAAVPGVYRQLLASDADVTTAFAGLRHGLSAGEALPAALAKAWTARTGKPLYEALGMSEISTYISFSASIPPVPGRVGVPQRGRRVAILPDEGTDEPVARGQDGFLAVSKRDPGLMLGYWNRPRETKDCFRGEWFITGDRARMHDDDTITYLGRADDVMTSGGFRVSPAEVEAALLSHPGISEVGVSEAEVRPGVRIIVARYVPSGAPVAETVLASHCADRLARYKCQRAFEPVQTLPRSSNGKLLRRLLRSAPIP